MALNTYSGDEDARWTNLLENLGHRPDRYMRDLISGNHLSIGGTDLQRFDVPMPKQFAEIGTIVPKSSPKV